jgi:hypothetical protein
MGGAPLRSNVVFLIRFGSGGRTKMVTPVAKNNALSLPHAFIPTGKRIHKSG